MVTRSLVLLSLAAAMCVAVPAATGQSKAKAKKTTPARPVPQKKKPASEQPPSQTKKPTPEPPVPDVKKTGAGQAEVQQVKAAPEKPKARTPRSSIVVMGGGGIPLGKAPLTDLWRYGPSFSADFLTTPVSGLWIGAGLDLTVLRFSYAGFNGKYPSGPDPLDRKVIWWDFYVLGRYMVVPGKSITPFVSVRLGATRPTPASFKVVFDTVRVTYYDIHPRARLSLGLSGGLDLSLTPELAFVAEANAVLVHNDPVFGSIVTLRGGFRWTW